MTPATSSLLLSLSPPSHSSPHILLIGSWGLIPPPLLSLLSLQGWESPTPGRKSSALAPSSCPPAVPGLGPCTPTLPTARPSWPGGALELCPPQPPAPGRGAYLCVPSVLSSMSPLSELPTRSPPWPACDLPPLGPSTDLPGPGSGALPLGPASRPPLTPPLRSRSGGA